MLMKGSWIKGYELAASEGPVDKWQRSPNSLAQKKLLPYASASSLETADCGLRVSRKSGLHGCSGS